MFHLTEVLVSFLETTLYAYILRILFGDHLPMTNNKGDTTAEPSQSHLVGLSQIRNECGYTGLGSIMVLRLREFRLLTPSGRGARVHAT